MELKELIQNFELFTTDEKEYWEDILPSMLQEQQEKLRNLIEWYNSKMYLMKISKDKEIEELNQKHLLEWEEFNNK